ncbi:hypothetical protein J4Q44_G00165140 [Coregonus suidteri]|uniref:Tetratricopeptide repeat protein 28 n=1 Tax=Coregonus suidteri TaxID=861788 RepID=A0AAN8LRM3_9TELE
MEKQATLKEKFSIFGTRTVGRAAQREAEEEGGRCGLNKAEFMERVQQSNEACQRGDFQAAVSLYGDALRADPQNCILYSNRSAALLKLGRYEASLDDAVKACLLNPKWPKDAPTDPRTAEQPGLWKPIAIQHSALLSPV